MAQFPDDAAEFWLPAEFLPDENLFLEKETLKDATFGPLCFEFPNEFEFDSFGSNSVNHSPVESTASSSETESSDEEFLAALTQRLAQSALYETKNWFLSGSPQATLAGVGRVPGEGKVSGHGSPNGPFQFPSPPETPFGTEKDTWDLAYAAAGQVANPFPHGRTHISARCSSPFPWLKDISSVSYASQHLHQNLPQSTQFHRRFYDQVLKDECSVEFRKMHGRYEPLQTSVHHPWQIQSQGRQSQIHSSTFRATSNEKTCANRESVGTGVFLPRSYSNPPEPRKHAAVRPVKFQETKESSRSPFNGGARRDYNVSAAPKYELYAQQSQAHGADAAQKKELLLLPLEWTY